MFDGPNRAVRVESSNPDAVVFINGRRVGPAPVDIALNRWTAHTLRIEAPGFEPWETQFEKHFNQTTQYNLFILFPPGFVVDLVTGAIFEIEPKITGPEVDFRPRYHATFDSSTRLTITTDLRRVKPGSKPIGTLRRKSSSH